MRCAARWLGVLGLLASVLPGGMALAQAVPDASGVADVPAGEGVIRGRVVHDDPRAAEGQTVVLYSLSPSGVPGLRTTLSGAGGEFRFEGVSNDPKTVYVVGARTGGVHFGTRLVFDPGVTEARVEVPITDPTADASAMAPGESRIRIDRGCTLLRVTESHQLGNPSERAIFVPEEERALREPLFRTELPEAAAHFETPLGSLERELVREDRTLRYWGPLRPGGRAIEFSYALPSTPQRQTFQRRFVTGAERMIVATHRNGIRASGPDLRPGPSVTIAGRPYRTVETGPLAPDSSLEITLEIPEAPATGNGISIREVRAWLELDDASLSVDERHQIEVAGPALLQAETDAPLLCLSLPAGAEGLRLSQDSLELGLAPDPPGGLAVYGPIPHGASSIAFRYQLQPGEPPVSFERRFPLGLPLLSVFVADTHLLVEAERLHRLRPMRGQTRTYLHLEGFEIEPEQPVSIRLTPLPPHRGISTLALTGLAAAVAVGAVGFLVAPLRGRAGEPRLLATADERVADERESLYAAIRDLDDDLEAAKISEADHAALRSDLRAQAIALMEAERRAAAVVAAAPEVPDACPRCRATFPAGALFCSQCGANLGRARGESAG